jgi:hypothetical protein
MGYDTTNTDKIERDAPQGADEDFGAWELGEFDIGADGDLFFE